MVAHRLDAAPVLARPPLRSRLDGPFWLMLRRGVRLAWRQRIDTAAALAFFLIVAALFPLALMPAPEARPTLAPAAAWVAALLAITLGSLRLFTEDAGNGVLEQVLLGPGSTGMAVAGVLAAHWVAVGLPLLAAAPVLALFYDLSAVQLGWLSASLLLGTPALCVLAALGAALSLGARAGGLLLALLVLPWCVPVLLFGVSAAQGAAGPALLLLAASTTFSLALGPLAVSAALRMGIE
ncbi:heme exporter protein CcmB [Aquabacterium sp. A7-Y]|uniref:heme exporter protein CcmB n=1 Tax=Aquabacterium sp. A7-Y TaxID=1349605 RepID=UPI00223D195A|nr:heme exporter protein CcmB [Aquabacterium sp. A7-Y]MCW7537907.1 heme exporter protein CcmB [Aquabacterium sp. A7-Y]